MTDKVYKYRKEHKRCKYCRHCWRQTGIFDYYCCAKEKSLLFVSIPRPSCGCYEVRKDI